jgi:hypothetical protein
MRKKVKNLIDQLAAENPKVPSNILHALSSLKPSQLMDSNYWDFKNLEAMRSDEEGEGSGAPIGSSCGMEVFDL